MIDFINERINIITTVGVFFTVGGVIYSFLKIKRKHNKRMNKNYRVGSDIKIDGQNNLNNSTINQSSQVLIDNSKKK